MNVRNLQVACRLSAALAAVALCPAAFADSIYHCKEDKLTSIQWSDGGFLTKPGLEAKTEDAKNDSNSVTLVVDGKNSKFKGNNGESSLEMLNETTFLERPPMGELIFWRLIPGKESFPTLLVQFKGYAFSGPYIHAWVFRCN